MGLLGAREWETRGHMPTLSVMTGLMALGVASADATCSICLADNKAAFSGDPGKSARAWCYSKSKCMDISLQLFTDCPDYTFDADTCLCRPDVYNSCAECASVSHLGCVWIANASVTNNVTYRLPYGSAHTIPPVTSFWKTGRCTQGIGFSPLGLESKNSFDLAVLSVNITNVVKPTSWFWAQCELTGPAMAAVLAGAVGVLCCLCCFCGCWCRSRKNRRARLLHVQGARNLLLP